MENDVLIIFQEIPEDLRVYKRKVDDSDLQMLRDCHHLMIGEDMPENLGIWLIDLIDDMEPIYAFGPAHDQIGWPMVLQDFSGSVIVTGMYL